MANVKILTNVPEIMTFKFNSWKKWDNKGKDGNYVTYSIGVENKGVDAYFSVYEKEYDGLFSKLGDLQDRTLEILKYEDGKYKNWKIMENGVDITPRFGSQNAPQAPTRPLTDQNAQTPTQSNYSIPEGQYLLIKTYNETLDKQRTVFRGMESKIKELEAKVEDLTKKVGYMTEMFKQANPDAYELHKNELPEPIEPEIPIIEPVSDQAKTMADALGIK